MTEFSEFEFTALDFIGRFILYTLALYFIALSGFIQFTRIVTTCFHCD